MSVHLPNLLCKFTIFKAMELSVVIPIYHTTRCAIAQIPEVIPALRSKYNDFEILFIIDNDDINDDVNRLFSLQDIYSEVKVHALDCNHGQHFATLSGYYLAQGDFIMSVDQDMTHYIPEICKSDDYKKFDIYYWHYDKNTMYTSVMRKVLSICFKAMIHRLINFKRNSTFRVLSKDLRDRILENKHIFWNIDVMVFNNTENIGGTELELFDVKDHDSSYNYKTLISVALELLYEHNTIFMNLMIALFPAIIIQYAYENMMVTITAYLFIVVIITLAFVGIKKATPSTSKKIVEALRAEKESALLEPVTE